jgi:formylglycine-generating enzyme required for sulfatase activity
MPSQAARAVTTATTQPRFYFGNDARELCSYANGADRSITFPWRNTACSDGYPFTAPVGSFRANVFELFDMHGNVWDWVEDCWNDEYNGAPTDGSPWTSSNCDFRVQRRGTWTDQPALLRSASRGPSRYVGRSFHAGFSGARTL